MAVDLFDFVDPLKREVNPPGSDLFPDATDDSWLGSLTDAFWEIRLYGMLDGYEENAGARGGPAEFGEGKVTPVGVLADYDDPSGYAADVDLPRELAQLVVLWAGWKIVLTRFGSLNSVFRAKAGPVEYETQQSATVLKALLDALKARIDDIIDNLSTYRRGVGVAVFDTVIQRTYAQAVGDTWWIR